MSMRAKLIFELTEWDADGDTRLRDIKLETYAGFSLPTLQMQFNGQGFTPAELTAVNKIVEGIAELHGVIKAVESTSP